MTTSPLIALISATPAAIGPAVAGIMAVMPTARIWNILDDRLMADAQDQGGVTPALEARMIRLIDHAVTEGSAGVLLTCSLYAEVASGAQRGIPVLPPDAAAFTAVLEGGFERILVLASFPGALADTLDRLAIAAEAAGVSPALVGAVSSESFAPAQAGDAVAVAAALSETVRLQGGEVDAVLLAQYSLAPARDALAESLSLPVFAGPQAAARQLAGWITG